MIDSITSILIWILLFGPVIVFFGYIIIADVKGLAGGHKPKLAKEPPVEAFDEKEYDAFLLVKNAYDSLKKQHACGYGPWLSSLLDGGYNFTLYKDSRGRVSVERQHRIVSPKVALTAVRFTMKELAGSRFDLSELSSAEAELLEMGA